MKVLVAARDVRVRHALSRLLELQGNRIVGATGAPADSPELAAAVGPDLVVLELARGEQVADLRVIGELARSGRVVIAVSGGPTAGDAVLAAGAAAYLDEDAEFADRLARTLSAIAAPPT